MRVAAAFDWVFVNMLVNDAYEVSVAFWSNAHSFGCAGYSCLHPHRSSVSSASPKVMTGIPLDTLVVNDKPASPAILRESNSLLPENLYRR